MAVSLRQLASHIDELTDEELKAIDRSYADYRDRTSVLLLIVIRYQRIYTYPGD